MDIITGPHLPSLLTILFIVIGGVTYVDRYAIPKRKREVEEAERRRREFDDD